MAVDGGRRAKDAAMAAYMKKHPGSFPDSAVRPWNGEGAFYRTTSLGSGWRSSPNRFKSRHSVAHMGGVWAARLGYGSYGIDEEAL